MYGEDFERQVDEIVARYPQPRGALMPLLHLSQDTQGMVEPEAEIWIADRLGLTPWT